LSTLVGYLTKIIVLYFITRNW